MFYFSLATHSSTEELSLIEPAAKQLNIFQTWWAAIDWEKIVGLLIQKTLTIIFLIVLFYLLAKIANCFIARTYESYAKRASMNENRLNTIHVLIKSIIQYTFGFFFIYAILSIIGIPVGSLLAGAGIAGIAIGLGAQGFMNDIITGFFIIMEQQIDVGDYIKLPNLEIEGTVTSVGIRTIQLKSIDGSVSFVPNRNITTITNTSRANMQVLVNVRINPNDNIEKMRLIIQQANHEVAQKYQHEIQTAPAVFGLVDLGNNQFAIQTSLYVTNGQQNKMKEEFLAHAVEALTKAGYNIPQTNVTTE